jgi:hypothetical protein
MMGLEAAAIMGGASLLGGMMASDASRSAANAQLQAGRESAQAQLEAARIAADAAKFRPYSLTTGFGRSFFNPDTQTAGYEIDPRLAAFRDALYGQAGQYMSQLGATSPEAEAQKYYATQMGLLAPTRAQEDVAARQAMLASGRIGLGVAPVAAGAGAGGGMLNPDEFARQRAREIVNAQIAAQSTDYGQSMIDKLMSRATGAFQSGAGIEELGMKPLTMGADIGNRASVSQGQQAQALLSGGINAARSNLDAATAANQYRLAGGLGLAGMLQQGGQTYAKLMQQQPSSMWGAPVNALSTAAYGPGLLGYQGAMADIYGY